MFTLIAKKKVGSPQRNIIQPFKILTITIKTVKHIKNMYMKSKKARSVLYTYAISNQVCIW